MNIINPAVEFNNYFDRTKYVIARNVAMATAILFLLLCYFFRAENTEIIIYYYIATVLTIGALIFVLYSKNYKLVFYSLCLGGCILVQVSANFGSHAMHYAGFLWAALSAILAFMGIGLVFGITIISINIIGILCFSIFFINENFAQLGNQLLTQRIGIAIEVSAVTFLTGYVMYHFVMFRKYSEELLQTANNGLEKRNKLINLQIEEKTVLIKEVHHRVKNNLQIIVSLLRMQKEDNRISAADKLEESINRVMAMALIHQKLYQQEDLAQIDVEEYILDLTREIQLIYDWKKTIHIEINSCIQKLTPKTLVPFGLLINELLTNSFKHAFSKTKKGSISIDIETIDGDRMRLIYSDTGDWKALKEASFGIELIESLTEQMDGTYKRKSSNYTFNLLNSK